jgi:asparagine synthase (glutamine-hydrolysing)
MCGISGIIGKKFNRQQLELMVRTQQHRGPDASQLFVNDENTAGLGHNRLSILDLSEAANQPMFSRDKRYIVVFNGEIYNYIELKQELEGDYPFQTSSDTEVLLAAWQKWGKACLDRLNGMFSFAIWDSQTNALFAARDRFGVKPFYYAITNKTIFFSSELKTLWAAGISKVPNEAVWAGYLANGSYDNGETFWENIFELPGGWWLEWKDAKITTERWYDFIDNIARTKVYSSSAELQEGYTALLIDAVSLRFRSDVPVGFNISGGLDSSILLAMVNHLFPEESSIKAFSFYTADERYDELPWVKSLLQHMPNPLTACLLTTGDVLERLSDMCYTQDAPFGGIPTLAYSRIFEEARKQDVIVLLDGQGMDEAWAGYDYYHTNSEFTVQGTASSPTKPKTLSSSFREKAIKPDYPKPFNDPLKNIQYRDLFFTKIPRALRFNDRVSMRYSTELREPFLDYRLIELAFAQDKCMKIADGKTKMTLRQIAAKYLGSDITQAPKRALQTPQREWLAGTLKPLAEAAVELLSDHPWFVADELKNEWQSYLDGRSDNSFYVWQWINTAQLLNSDNYENLLSGTGWNRHQELSVLPASL